MNAFEHKVEKKYSQDQRKERELPTGWDSRPEGNGGDPVREQRWALRLIFAPHLHSADAPVPSQLYRASPSFLETVSSFLPLVDFRLPGVVGWVGFAPVT